MQTQFRLIDSDKLLSALKSANLGTGSLSTFINESPDVIQRILYSSRGDPFIISKMEAALNIDLTPTPKPDIPDRFKFTRNATRNLVNARTSTQLINMVYQDILDPNFLLDAEKARVEPRQHLLNAILIFLESQKL